jgi:PAS domain-containing protein
VARPASAFSVPVGAVLAMTALLTGVGLVLSAEADGSLPLTVQPVPAMAVVLVTGTVGIYLLLAAWSTLASGPGSAHPPGRRLRLALLLLAMSASSLLIALPAAGALVIDVSGPSGDVDSWTGAYARILGGALVAAVSGAGGAFLLRDVRRRRARQRQRHLQRQRAREAQASRARERSGRTARKQPCHLPEQRRDGQPRPRTDPGPDRQRASG